MKKQYEAPKAELMEFDYEENVVASGATENDITGNPWVGERGNGNGNNKTGCTKLEKC